MLTSTEFSFEEIKKMIENDDLKGLKAALAQENFDVNIKDQYGATALHLAARSDSVEILKVLLNHPDIIINAKNRSLMTPLMFAASKGNIRSLKILLENGADASCCDLMNCTALTHASDANSVECIEALLKRKNCTPDGKRMMIHSIPHRKDIFGLITSIIIESLADDPYYIKTFGSAILYHGCANGSLDIVKFIVEKDVLNVNTLMDFCKLTPLQAAIRCLSLEIADYLIQKGAKLIIKDDYGQSAYDYAAKYDISETFLEKYEPEERFLEKMFEALILKFRFKTLRAYADKCAARQKYPNGPRILNRAASYALKKKCVGSLINLLPYITDKDFLVRLAIEVIAKWKYMYFGPLYERFLELETESERIKEVNGRLIVFAMKKANKFVVDYLLERGLDPNETYYGCSFLNMACQLNVSFVIVESLILHGADVNQSCNYYMNPLLYAVFSNNPDNVRILLNYGANPRPADHRDFTPLLFAAYHAGHEEVFFELFKFDTNLKQRTKKLYLTPFLAACSSGSMSIAKALIEAGACFTDVDIQNRNCLHFAADKLNLSGFIALLLEKLDKKDIYAMLIAADTEGDRPVDIFVRNSDSEPIANLFQLIPDLANIIEGPKCIKIQNDSDDQEMCLICRDNFMNEDSAIVLQCKHVFHQDCFSEWGKVRGICPYCQRSTHTVKNK